MSELLRNIDARTRLAGTNKLEILLFTLGTDPRTGRRETFGINVFKVREVMRTPPITAAPEMPSSVEGMVSLRGVLVPVVDLAKYAGMSIDSPREWEDTIERQDEVTALGRKVRWARERVLVYALESKPYAGVRLDSPSRVIRLAHGVLYWPVRQVQPETGANKASVLTRPCVMTTIDRAYWQRIKVVPARP